MKRVCIYFMIAALLTGMTGLTGCGDEEAAGYDDYEAGADNSGNASASKGLFMQVEQYLGFT